MHFIKAPLTRLTRYFRAPKSFVKAHLLAPFWKNGLASSTSHLNPLSRLRQPILTFDAAAFRRPHGILAQVQNLRIFTSPTRLKDAKPDPVPAPPALKLLTSLIAVPIYEKSPASVGIDGWEGYEKFIPAGTTLPCSKSMTLGSAFDYIGEDDIPVSGFLPGVRLRVVLAKLAVRGIRKARKENTTFEATILLRSDLTGMFTVRFTPHNGNAEKTKVAVEFSAEKLLTVGKGNDNAVASVETGIFVVLEERRKDIWAQT
ncbi:hypothetical protein MMC30_008602 [Trapelia coarctata]|nr:hypothetical protein [Trapelia coarctata]